MGFFPEGSQSLFKNSNPLVSVVRPLPVSARQAMYAAAEKGLIVRRSWNGCAWNAASLIETKGKVNAQSFESAADVFGCSPHLVRAFIQVWDSLKGSDEKCTATLKDAIDQVGLSTEEGVNKAVRVIRGYAYKSLDTQFKEQLAEVENIADLPGMSDELIEKTLCTLNSVGV